GRNWARRARHLRDRVQPRPGPFGALVAHFGQRPAEAGVSVRSRVGLPQGPTRLLVHGDLLSNLVERAADQPRDVPLRDADLLGDLGLLQALKKAEVEDRALAVAESGEPRLEYGPLLGALVLVLPGPKRLEGMEVAFVALAGTRRQRERAV